jgi:hypothetical protein
MVPLHQLRWSPSPFGGGFALCYSFRRLRKLNPMQQFRRATLHCLTGAGDGVCQVEVFHRIGHNAPRTFWRPSLTLGQLGTIIRQPFNPQSRNRSHHRRAQLIERIEAYGNT